MRGASRIHQHLLCSLLLLMLRHLTLTEGATSASSQAHSEYMPARLGRRMLSECLATETAFTKNNIFEAADCEEGAVCCCSGNVYVSDGGVNFCCIPGYQGCDAPTYDMTFAFTKGYGCYSTTAGCPSGSVKFPVASSPVSSTPADSSATNTVGSPSADSLSTDLTPSDASSSESTPASPSPTSAGDDLVPVTLTDGSTAIVNSNDGSITGGDEFEDSVDWGR